MSPGNNFDKILPVVCPDGDFGEITSVNGLDGNNGRVSLVLMNMNVKESVSGHWC